MQVVPVERYDEMMETLRDTVANFETMKETLFGSFPLPTSTDNDPTVTMSTREWDEKFPTFSSSLLMWDDCSMFIGERYVTSLKIALFSFNIRLIF